MAPALSAAGNQVLVRVTNVSKRFGGVVALDNVTLEVGRGEFIGLLGPNGSGKTTLFNVLTGVVKPTSGQVEFAGRSIVGLPLHETSLLGLVRTFQNAGVFRGLSVVDNVAVAMDRSGGLSFAAMALGLPSARRQMERLREKAYPLLRMVGLAERAQQPASTLTYGQQRLLELARALAMEPDVLLLDEPLAGLTRAEALAVMERLRELHQRGQTIVIIEHNVRSVMRYVQRVVLLHHGQVLAEGTPEEVWRNRAVVDAYLGSEADGWTRPKTHASFRWPGNDKRADHPKTPILEVEDIQVDRGGIPVLHRVSLSVRPAELVAVIGPNGAGKSTLLLTVAGLLKPKRGRILLEGVEISGACAEQVNRLGLSLVPEGRQIFPDLTVEENLLLGGFGRMRRSRSNGSLKALRASLSHVYELFPRLAERRHQRGGTLSGGEQQMLAIGRALMSDPKILLLDEPSSGLAPRVVQEIMRVLARLKNQGMAICLVEQNASAALDVADRVYVLEGGEVWREGLVSEVAQDRKVQEAYLGVS